MFVRGFGSRHPRLFRTLKMNFGAVDKDGSSQRMQRTEEKFIEHPSYFPNERKN